MATNAQITIELDGSDMTISLFDELAPRTCKALRKQLPVRGDIVHAMWSGPLCLLRGQNFDDAPLENPTTFLAPGDVIYHPTHHQIGIAYAVTQFREPIGSVYVTLLGRIADDLDGLVRVGRNLQRTGAKPIALQ